jgi:hypothetical protein
MAKNLKEKPPKNTSELISFCFFMFTGFDLLKNNNPELIMKRIGK